MSADIFSWEIGQERVEQLELRKTIVSALQAVPVPRHCKAHHIIKAGVEVIQGYKVELETATSRNNVLKARLVELEARLNEYFVVGGDQ